MANRWNKWAEQFRRRHSRRELNRASRSLVLLKRTGANFHVLFANRRTIVHVHARIGVLLMPAPALLSRCATPQLQSSIGALRGSLEAPTAAPLSSESPATATARRSAVATAPAFLRSPDVFAPETKQLRMLQRNGERPRAVEQAIPARVLARRWREPAAVSAHVELSARLRRRTARQELPISGRTTVLARQNANTTVADRQGEAIDREYIPRARAEWTGPAPPPLNVEALTSQVIQQLDRRLIAYRERMGRV